MKTIQNISTNNVAGNKLKMSTHQVPVPDSKLSSGSVVNKFPVTLDGGKTIIFISDKAKASETKRKYELRMGNLFVKYSKKHKV